MTLRPVRFDDLDLICRHRRDMFRDGRGMDPAIDEAAGPYRAWLEPRLRDGRYFGYVLEVDGKVAASCGLEIVDWPPSPRHPNEARRGYVSNVFVEPEFRRRGYGRLLMEAAAAEFERLGISYAYLHATDAGVPLYLQLGWQITNEMAKFFTRKAS